MNPKINSTKPFYNTTIPSDWEILEFGEFAETSKGKYVPDENENLRCLELEHFEQGTGHILGWMNSSEQKSTKNVFKKGQVLFGKLRPYLKKYWLAEFDGVCSSEVWVLSTKNKKCINEFLFRLVQSNQFIQVSNVSSGSKMPRADWNYISTFPFLLPPLPEQRAIANLLSAWDTAINKSNQLIAQKQVHKKWLMQNLLTGRLRLRSASGERFGGEWKKVKLGDIFERVIRKNTEGCTNVVTISAQRGFVRQTDFFNKKIASTTLDNYFLVKNGEFCYNKSYSNGYPKGATKRLNNYEQAVVTTLYICFGIKENHNSNGDFFEQYFEANYLDRGLTKIAHEGGRAHGLLNVTPSDFFALKITIPSIEEQTAIAKVLQTADEEIKVLTQKRDYLKEQKKGMMQQLLTGKKRLKIV
ncbi:MAG: restriction endonuclease subunit S [Bacteroidetes bacterium]|nr:MAG: restriction endonuclease subunit S [Bacteroidota bacterium]